MNDEPTRRQIAAAFEMSVELLERVGGCHNLTAAFLRRQLAETAASRLRHRDAAIVALRRQWLAHESTSAAARLIARDLGRYAASAWKRRDRAFAEPPESYKGTPLELAFRIVALSGAKLPGVAAVRKILDVAGAKKIIALESRRYLQLDSSRVPRTVPMFIEDNAVASTLGAMPEFVAARERAVESAIESRRRHIAAIAKLDAEASKAWPREEKRAAEAIAKVRQAERDLAHMNRELMVVQWAIAGERSAREIERRGHEAELLKGDWRAIDDFTREANEEYSRVAKIITVSEFVSRNPATGKATRKFTGDGGNVKARLAAIIDSIRAAPDLRLLADVRELPARLAAMRASWPTVEDLAPVSGAGKGTAP